MMPTMTASCGGDKGNEPDEPGKNEEVVTRVQDRDGMIFLQDGKLVEANTAFSTSLLHQALTESNWKRDYGILYDNKHISGIFDLSNAALPLMLMTDQTAMFPYSSKRPYTLSGKTMTIAADPVSSKMYPVDKYTIVAVDYTPTMKRIATDDIYSTPVGLCGNIDNGWGIMGALSYSRRVIHH